MSEVAAAPCACPRRVAIGWHAGALLLYSVLALLMTWPLATRLTSTAIGAAAEGEVYDSWQNIWNLWWLKRALLSGQNPYFSALIYYPDGASLFLHTLNPLNFLVTLPVQAVFGLVVAFNIAVLTALTLGGYTAALLARDVTGDSWAALVAGTSFASSGYLLSQGVGAHLNLLTIWPLPLALLMLRRAATTGAAPRRQRVAASLWAGAALALCLLADIQYFLFALLWAAWYALWLVIACRARRAALMVVGALAIAFGLALPLLLPTARLALATPAAAAQGGDGFRLSHSLDLADLIIPSALHPLWGDAAARWQAYKSAVHVQSKTAYLGLMTLALALLGLRQRGARFWLVSALLFLLLALDSQLQIAGHASVPLPGALLRDLPLLNLLRYPIRFVALTSLALAVLAALGWRSLMAHWRGERKTEDISTQADEPSLASSSQRHSSPGTARTARNHRRAMLLSALAIGLIVLDNLSAPFPLTGVYIPSQIEAIAHDPDPVAVMHVPVYWRTRSLYMLYQTVHNKPLVGGYLSRDLPYPTIERVPLLRMLAHAAPAPDIIGDDIRTIAPSVFAFFNIRYLMLHSEGGALRYNTLVAVAEAAAGGSAPDRVLIPGSSILAYRLAPPTTPLPFLGIGAGWSEPLIGEHGVERRLNGAGELFIYSAAPRKATLILELSAGNAAQLGTAGYDDALNAQRRLIGPRRLELDFLLQRGVTTISVQSDANGATVRRIKLVAIK